MYSVAGFALLMGNFFCFCFTYEKDGVKAPVGENLIDKSNRKCRLRVTKDYGEPSSVRLSVSKGVASHEAGATLG